jgi:hypothetical protein
MLIRIAVSSLLAAVSSAAATPPTAETVSWADVREAIGACICVTPYTHEGTEYFVPQAGQCDQCRPPDTETGLSMVVDSAYEAAQPILIALKPPGLKEAGMPDAGLTRDERTRLVRQAYLEFEPFRRLILRHLPTALTEAGLVCPDCPPWEPRPPRHVDWSDYLPYLTAHVWPDPVVTPTGDGETPAEEPRYGFHVCVGLNGVGEMRDPDPHLVRAGYLGAFHTQELMQKASAYFGTILAEGQFTALDNDDARTRYLRRRLPEEIANDAEVKSAVCGTLDDLADELDLVVDGCDAANAPQPSEQGS